MTRLPITLVLLAALLWAAGAAHAGERRVPRGFYGVMWNRAGTDAPEATQERQFRLMARSGVESVRTVFSWAAAQPSGGGEPRFQATDRVVALAARHGIRLLPIVIYTPRWAARYPGRGNSPPARVEDYAAYLEALVVRYGSAGTFWEERPRLRRQPVRYWQIWNEPNFDGFWYVEGESPGAWASEYAALLSSAHDAIKRIDPGAQIVLAGLTNYAWDDLQALYGAGARGYFDVAALNLFTSSPSNVLRGARLMHEVLSRAGDGRKEVWITETTWPASQNRAVDAVRQDWHLNWETTPVGMASRLRRLYALAARHRRSLRLGGVYWYTWATAYGESNLFNYSGLSLWDGKAFYRQPALKAYTRSARVYQGCRKASNGNCRRAPGGR